MFKILITGSKNWDDYERLEKEVVGWVSENVNPKAEVVLVGGGRRGTLDPMVERLATERGWGIEYHPISWASFREDGANGWTYRTGEMVDAGVLACLYFKDPDSIGGLMVARFAMSSGIKTVKFSKFDQK